MFKYIMILSGVFFVVATCSGQTKNQDTMKRYVKVPAGYLMVLKQGDDLMKELETFAGRERIPSANISGMGFVNISFGFFNFEKKKYEPKAFDNVELANMVGTIAWQQGKPSIHAHGVVAGRDFVAYGGHILSASVSTGSLEILITLHDKSFERKMDEQLGANVLDITGKK